jgi:iron complex transport system substrate-binding protein
MRIRTRILAPLFMALALTTLILTGCGNSTGATTATSLSFTDATNTTVTLAKTPTRIACLVGICEDILATLGIQPVAVNDTLGQDPHFFGDAAKSFATIGGQFFAPNVEDIAKVTPDLVIGLANVHEQLRDALKPIAPLYIMNPASYNDSVKYLKDIGRLTGKSAAADAAVTKFQNHLADVKRISPNNLSTVLIYGSDVNFNLMTAGSLPGSLISQATPYAFGAPAAGAPAASDKEPGAIPSSVDKILEQDPDTLLIASFAFAPGAQPLSKQLAANPAWKNLSAVKNGKVYEINPSYYVFGRGTISLTLALDNAMHQLYPSNFPNDVTVNPA